MLLVFTTGLEVSSVSLLGQLTVGGQITDYFNCWFSKFCLFLGLAVVLRVQITDEGRSLYIGSFCPAMTSLSRYLEEVAFGISMSSSVFIFLFVPNVTLTTKGLQEKKTQLVSETTVEK